MTNLWREIESDGAGLMADDTQAGSEDLLERWFAVSPSARKDIRSAARRSSEQRFDIGSWTVSLVEVFAANHA